MKLTEEAREAIRKEVSNFLRGWGTVLGVTNLIALGGILWFVFTQLPVTAAELAEAQILSQVSLVTEPVINRALEAFEDVNNRQARVEICYGPEYLVTKRTDQIGMKERQKRPIRVSFSLRRTIASYLAAKLAMKLSVNRVVH